MKFPETRVGHQGSYGCFAIPLIGVMIDSTVIDLPFNRILIWHHYDAVNAYYIQKYQQKQDQEKKEVLNSLFPEEGPEQTSLVDCPTCGAPTEIHSDGIYRCESCGHVWPVIE